MAFNEYKEVYRKTISSDSASQRLLLSMLSYVQHV